MKVLVVARAIFQRWNPRPIFACRPRDALGRHVKGEQVKNAAQDVAQDLAQDVLGAEKDGTLGVCGSGRGVGRGVGHKKQPGQNRATSPRPAYI